MGVRLSGFLGKITGQETGNLEHMKAVGRGIIGAAALLIASVVHTQAIEGLQISVV
jgi:hypothetical protein